MTGRSEGSPGGVEGAAVQRPPPLAVRSVWRTELRGGSWPPAACPAKRPCPDGGGARPRAEGSRCQAAAADPEQDGWREVGSAGAGEAGATRSGPEQPGGGAADRVAGAGAAGDRLWRAAVDRGVEAWLVYWCEICSLLFLLG